MARYIFRLNTDNSDGQSALLNTLKHWDSSVQYGNKEIASIKGSNDNAEEEPTSIPSPFARIALAKTAFSEVAEFGDKASAAYKKIVSECLDVAEIFFTFDKWKDEIEIVKWDKNADLPKLANHKILFKTLNTFLENDAEIYNFNLMNSLYILKHKRTGKMLGSTSPCTLFLNSPNRHILDIPLSNNHNAFSDTCPLHMRSWDFQKYLYTWVKLNNQIRLIDNRPVSIFDEFIKYLVAQKNIPDENNPNKINNLDPQNLPDNFDNYIALRAPDVEILGKYFHKSKADQPDLGYLRPSDFLEDIIIRLPYKIQTESFFDGNLNDNSKFSYLIPVKEKFFERYTVSDLKNFIRINEVGTNVEVKLKIPKLQKEIKRIYQESDTIHLLENGFDCMLFPNVKFSRKEYAYYRFGIFLPYSNSNQADKYSVEFFSGLKKHELEPPIIRNTNDGENPISKVYSLNQDTFDRIKITCSNASGILIPLLPVKDNSEVYSFAIDFGTTNTHIEYNTSSDQTIRPFDIDENNKQIDFLLAKNEGNILVTDIDFIPIHIGENKKFKFPVRTALSLAKNRDSAKKVSPFVQANIIIPYEKKRIPKYNQVLTQLKWDSTEDEMGYYIDSLCYILRNKVVLNGGILSETKIVWFYPLSMAGSRSKIIAEKWRLAYAKYFLGHSITSEDSLEISAKQIICKNIIELPESIAPFLCYNDDINYRNVINNLVSIDIGGGTTDIVFIRDGRKAEYVTSFRFAANSIFGIGEHITPVVTKYKSEIEHIIEQHDPHFTLRNILSSISGSKSGDLASFFFSLVDNEMLKEVDINFNLKLKRDQDQKIIFVIFYTAIIYHIAKIMKAKNLQLPRHIAFSGNGSRIVNIVADKDILTELSKHIFEKVFGQKYGNSGLDIIQNTRNPKEVTCKGGLKAAEKDYIQTPFEPLVLLGIDDSTFVSDNKTYSSVNIEECVTKTNMQIKEFFDYLINDLLRQKYTKGVIAESFSHALNLNQKTLKIALNICNKDEDLATFTKNGIQRKIETITDTANTQIEETFFFYPIASLLNAISTEINRIN